VLRSPAGGRRDEEDEVGRAVGAPKSAAGCSGRRQRRLRDVLGAAVRDRDAAGQAGGRLPLAGHRVGAQAGASPSGRRGDPLREAVDDLRRPGAEVGVEVDEVDGDQFGHGEGLQRS
jgi:hypothetical protein